MLHVSGRITLTTDCQIFFFGLFFFWRKLLKSKLCNIKQRSSNIAKMDKLLEEMEATVFVDYDLFIFFFFWEDLATLAYDIVLTADLFFIFYFLSRDLQKRYEYR